MRRDDHEREGRRASQATQKVRTGTRDSAASTVATSASALTTASVRWSRKGDERRDADEFDRRRNGLTKPVPVREVLREQDH
ncbi:hypothetical protein C9J85_11605 [Haloferax sp. wsp5]|nr:hypothetical protein C9J85_11605 [Haloferax sp. wsp5]